MVKIKRSPADPNFLTELHEMSKTRNLMILGLDTDTGELVWEIAPDWDALKDDCDRFTLYYSKNPNQLIARRFKSLPVNTQMPVSFIQTTTTTDIDEELEEDLIILKAELLTETITSIEDI